MMPISIASAPRSAPTVRSSITVSGAGRAPARSSAERSVVCCTREAAADLARAADDRLADDGRAQHLAVEHDGERLADIGARDVAELPRAEIVEAERDDRLVRLIESEARASVSRSPETAMRSSTGYGLPVRRRAACRCPAARSCVPGGPSMWKVSFAVLPSSVADPLRVLHAGQLHQDAVGADALDRRLGDADLVDAAADDFEALLDRRLRTFGMLASVGVTVITVSETAATVDVGRARCRTDRSG